MTGDTRDRFDAGADAWAEYNRQPRGHIRAKVTWRNLLPHLPPLPARGDPPRVLDAGGGSGELALQLVARGYRVWLLDFAPGMLEQARRAAQQLPPEVRNRLTCRLGLAEEAGAGFAAGSFDAITCHTLVEYVAEPQALLRELVPLLAPGGLLSLSFVNRHAEVLRQVWSRGDPAGALARLAGEGFCARLFDVQGRAYTAGEATGWLEDLGLTVAATYGVRVFADQVPAEQLEDPHFLEALLRLECAVAGRSPYRDIARYVQLIACKEPG
jgi:S-adenosylmethionine-dependent methyltransferase